MKIKLVFSLAALMLSVACSHQNVANHMMTNMRKPSSLAEKTTAIYLPAEHREVIFQVGKSEDRNHQGYACSIGVARAGTHSPNMNLQLGEVRFTKFDQDGQETTHSKLSDQELQALQSIVSEVQVSDQYAKLQEPTNALINYSLTSADPTQTEQTGFRPEEHVGHEEPFYLKSPEGFQIVVDTAANRKARAAVDEVCARFGSK